MSQTMSPEEKSRKSSARPPTPSYDDLASAEDRAFQKVQRLNREHPNLTDREAVKKLFP